MEKEKEKKGLLGRLSGGRKTKKSSCCSFEIEELAEESAGKKDGEDSSKSKNSSCCN